MGKKKGHNSYFIGKGIAPTDNGSTPVEGAPNTNLDTYSKKSGRFKQRRKFGANGRATKDYDMPHGHKPNVHVHDFADGKRKSEDRPPRKKERREISKAKRKRRPWKKW